MRYGQFLTQHQPCLRVKLNTENVEAPLYSATNSGAFRAWDLWRPLKRLLRVAPSHLAARRPIPRTDACHNLGIARLPATDYGGVVGCHYGLGLNTVEGPVFWE